MLSFCCPVVADDERDTREYLEEYLSHLGHDVRAAADGRQLVEVCRAFGPDLVVTDYSMPGLDGLAAAAVNRERPVPVVLSSGRHESEGLAQAGRTPVVRFLAKPVKEGELRAAVEAALREVVAPNARREIQRKGSKNGEEEPGRRQGAADA